MLKALRDLEVGDIVAAYNGRFQVVKAPRDSIGHAPKDPISGWPIGPSGVVVVESICIEGEARGYFEPGSDWVFQGNRFAAPLEVVGFAF